MFLSLLFIYIVTIWLGLRFQSSSIIFRFIFLVAWGLMAGNYYNADYDNYLYKYEMGMDLSIDIGFGFLCHIFHKLGFNYIWFKAIVSFICLCLIFYSISKLSKKKSFYASIFLLYPFLIDITQFRNFIAYSIIYYALLNLFSNSKLSIVKYVILIIIASSIHTTSIFYMIFVFAKARIKIWHILVGLYVVSVFKMFMTSSFQLYYETNKVDVREIPSTIGALYTALPLFFFCLLYYYCDKFNKSIDINKLSVWRNVSLLMLLIIPLYFINTNFSRLFRNILLIDIIFLYDYITTNKKFRLCILSILLMFFSYSNYFAGTYYESVLVPVFKYNILISSF